MHSIYYKANFIILITVLSVNLLFGEVHTDIVFMPANDVKSNVQKSESLLLLSQKLESIDLNLSLEASKQALRLSNKIDDNRLKANCNQQYGQLLYLTGKTDLGIKTLKSALELYEKSNIRFQAASTLVQLGKAYQSNDQFKKSLIYFNSSLADFKLLNDSSEIAKCHIYIAESYNLLGDNESAMDHINKAMSISINNNYIDIEAIAHLKLGEVYIVTNNSEEAKSQLIQAMELADSVSDIETLSKTKLELSDYYLSIGDSTIALSYLSEYLAINAEIEKNIFIKLESFLISISDLNSEKKTSSLSLYLFIGLTVILIIILGYVLFRIKKLRVLHNSIIEKSSEEIIAFEKSTSDLDAKIETKTNERLAEIEEEIRNNKLSNVAIRNSQKNLNQVNYLKDMFLSKISHEIRTPLSGILGFAEILETQLALEEEEDLFEFASSITESGMSLVSLLNNILDISRLNSNNMQLDIKKLNIIELIQTIVDNFNPKASLVGLKLIYDSKEIPEIETDGVIFSKIVSLIIDNSIKFTEKGFIKISQDSNESEIAIYIKDTGIGIDKVYIDQVFEPYRQESLGYSTSYQGAGLGLPLAKKMANKLGGKISISSEKGIGTTLVLNFPISHNKIEDTSPIASLVPDVKSPKETKSVSEKKSLPWETKTVLVVEDDNMNQILYKKLLKTAEHLDIVKDGKTAFSIIEKQRAKDRNFDFILMDINLPAPWDGISLMKEIRNRWPDYKEIPFIAQTAYAISGNREAMLEEGFDEYITKPIIKTNLIETIKTVLNS